MSAAPIVLVVIFNHRYEGNIPRLDEFYAPRFSRRHYVVPFAPWDHPQAIRVVENGQNFSGHIAQAASRFVEEDAAHYVFVSDDLILNPAINETNIAEILAIGTDAAYIKSLTPSWQLCYSWPWASVGLNALRDPSFDMWRELPSPEETIERFRRVGLRFERIAPRSPLELARTLRSGMRAPMWLMKLLALSGRGGKYPLLAGYADFLTVPAARIRQFVDYCGVFAAANVFAELAIPTALALSCDDIRTELRMGEFFFDPQAVRDPQAKRIGKELWLEERERFEQQFGNQWQRLLKDFPDDLIYVHPVKLSRWK
jgi:hypothetical protein